ncbi:MAG: hypothetical protein IKA74_06095 [Clostridia bacterium]|nr:hypothetical protein [Clostridia bacterium]
MTTPTTTEENSSIFWRSGEFIDEFERPTGEKYIFIVSYGKFTNSSTAESNLKIELQVTKDSFAIMLWEYGNILVTGTSYGPKNFSITVLDQNEIKHYYSGQMPSYGTRIYIDNLHREDLLSLLNESGEIKFYIEYSEYTKSSYLFTVSTTGFSSLYSQL